MILLLLSVVGGRHLELIYNNFILLTVVEGMQIALILAWKNYLKIVFED